MRKGLFWGSAGLSAWVLAGYPATLAALPRRPWAADDTHTPPVTIIVAAFREREMLATKLRAFHDLDYPADLLQVLVMVDEDQETARMAAEAYPPARVLFQAERGGKPAALNRGLELATGDVVVMTDANNVLAPGSVRAAVRHFADPEVTIVAGKRGERGSTYDAYEDLIRRLETRTGCVAGIFGEFVAIRRLDCPEFPTDAVTDDLWLLCTMMRKGGRSIYEPQAASSEAEVPNAAEVARRSRMAAGRFMMAKELKGLPPSFLWRVISHKYGRLTLPFLLPVAFVTALSLAGRGRTYRLAALAQLAMYGPGLLRLAGHTPPGPAGKLSRASSQFILGNYAVGRGVVRGLRKAQSIRWDPVR
ncbi:MAG: glycosyltransferase [Thermoleophilia bacterium]